jgi:DNA polymerase elongation subunit (family B)
MEIYESNIPPLLRYFHINNISPSGWIYVPVNRSTESTIKSTTCTYEFICKKSQIKSLPDKETRVPYKICSFDIEASSSHGDFPIPVKSYKRLATNMVDVFQSLLKNNSQAVTLLKKVVLTAFGFDKFAGVDLVYPKAKHVITKSRIEKLVDILLTEPIENAKKMNTEENNAAVLTIDMMFAQQANEIGADDTKDVGNDDAECDMESAAKFYGKPKPQKTIVESNTLIEVLTNGNYDREEKITLANDVLTLLFPSLEGDKVTFIGSTFMKYGEPEPYLNHCLVLNDCDPVDGAIIDCAPTERDILCKWTELIQEENPDIIIGYNIFGFDYEFMFRRAQENNCEREFLMLSRKRDELCAKEDNQTRELSIANQKIVLASGEYDLHYFEMSGRLQIDMYTYFRRDFNLPSYKLDSVAGQYISDDIKRVEYVDHPEFGKVTELFSKNLTGLHKNDYIHIEMIGFTSDYIQDGKKFKVVSIETGREIMETIKGKETTNKYNIIIIEGHPEMDRSKALKWGTAKDDVSPQDIFRLANGSSADRAVVAKYCIQDCNLVHHLMNKIDVITAYIEMSRICSVPISFLVFRGQGIKLTSYVAKKCREKDTLMPDIAKTTEADGYEGAIVLPPKCSMYMDNPVACVDYSSLYPSSMISQNLSHDSKVWTKEYDLDGKLVKETGEKDKDGNYIYDNLPNYQYINIEFDTFKTFRKIAMSKVEKKKSGVMVCRWAQLPNGEKSILPSILEELLSARSQTRKMIKTESDPFMQNILDKRQLGYKVTANSLYGQCGAKTSTFYEKDIAASTTATGRQMIIYAKTIIEEVYGNREYETECHGPVLTNAEYVYGDTDSVFFTFNLKDNKTGEKIRGKKALEITIEIAQDAAKLCSKFLKPPMDLTYEKTLMPFILLSKKRYVGMLYEEDANKGKLKYMGLSLKRRDSCDYLKDVYGNILNILMKENNVQSAIQFLDTALDNLIAGNVPMEKLEITKALRSDYKNPNQIAHKVLADRIGQRDPGNKPKPGDRMKFVFIVNSKGLLMGDRIETPEYIITNNQQIDYMYYITNQLMKPLQQLFGLAVEQIWEHQGKTAAIKTFRKDMEKLEKETGDLEEFMKKKEKYCSKKSKPCCSKSFWTKYSTRKTKFARWMCLVSKSNKCIVP